MFAKKPTPYTRPVFEPEPRLFRPWTPEGQLLLREALQQFGRSIFVDEWTGSEFRARPPVFGPPQRPEEPDPDAQPMEVIAPDRSKIKIPRPVHYVVEGRSRIISYEEALERFENEKEELERLWQEEIAAWRRGSETQQRFRQVMHAGHVSAAVLTDSGTMHQVPRRIWAGTDAGNVFRSGRAEFAMGQGYSVITVEGFVLVSESSLNAHIERAKREGSDEDKAEYDASVDTPKLQDQAAELPAGDAAHAKAPKRQVGGRPSKWDWEDCLVEICRIVFLDGLPNTQAEMVKRLQDWFIGQFDNCPAESEIKKRVSKVFRAIREAENPEAG